MENIQKTLQLKFLPESFGQFNGRRIATTSRKIVEKRINDFTKLVKGKPTVSSTFEIVETKGVSNGMYGLDLLHSYVHGNGYEVDIVNNTISFEHKSVTIQEGPFAGLTYWLPFVNVQLVLTDIGFDFEWSGEPYMNTRTDGAFKGYPEVTNGANPNISIERWEYVKTQTKTIGPIKSFPIYTKSELLQKSQLSEEEIVFGKSLVWHFKEENHNTHMNSTAAEIVVNEDGSLTGEYFINGINVKEMSPAYRNLITNYDKKHPGYVQRWILDNGDEPVISGTMAGYGGTFVMQMASNQDNTIKVVAGNQASWDANTRTLTFNQNKPAILSYYTEEMPAQGKNWRAEAYRDLNFGINVPTARGFQE